MEEKESELLGYLSIISDPGLDRKKLYSLTDILFIVICASLCGCDTWEDIHLMGTVQEDWLRGYISLDKKDGRVIAIDGKRLRGSYGNGKSAIPELLDGLLIKGSVVTLDAMGCQKSIVKKIIWMLPLMRIIAGLEKTPRLKILLLSVTLL